MELHAILNHESPEKVAERNPDSPDIKKPCVCILNSCMATGLWYETGFLSGKLSLQSFRLEFFRATVLSRNSPGT